MHETPHAPVLLLNNLMNSDLSTINFLTTEELARLLSISKTSVYRLISNRSIPFYKIRHNIRFKKSDVLDYLENNCIKSIDHI